MYTQYKIVIDTPRSHLSLSVKVRACLCLGPAMLRTIHTHIHLFCSNFPAKTETTATAAGQKRRHALRDIKATSCVCVCSGSIHHHQQHPPDRENPISEKGDFHTSAKGPKSGGKLKMFQRIFASKRNSTHTRVLHTNMRRGPIDVVILCPLVLSVQRAFRVKYRLSLSLSLPSPLSPRFDGKVVH